MYKGDIDNAVPRRILVTWEALVEEVAVQRRFLGFTTGLTHKQRINKVTMTLLWNYVDRATVRIELVNFGIDEIESERRFALLDDYPNPIRRAMLYADIADLLDDVPFMPDVIGIIDTPENQARYGGRGIGLDYLQRSI